MYILMSVGLGAQEAFLLSYGSRDTRRVDFPWVDGLSTDTPGLGHHRLQEGHGVTENDDGLIVDDVEPTEQVSGELPLPPYEPPLRRFTRKR